MNKNSFYTNPPKIAKYGLSGFSIAFEKKTNSFCIRNPAVLRGRSTPTMELENIKETNNSA